MIPLCPKLCHVKENVSSPFSIIPLIGRQNPCNLGWGPPVARRGIARHFFYSVWKFTAWINASPQIDLNLMLVIHSILSIVSSFSDKNTNFQVNSTTNGNKAKTKAKRPKLKMNLNPGVTNMVQAKYLSHICCLCFVFYQVAASCKSARNHLF